MPRGVFLTKDQKILIHDQYLFDRLTPVQIYARSFQRRNICSFVHIQRLCHRLEIGSNRDRANFICGPNLRGGRPRRMTYEEISHIRRMIEHKNYRKLSVLRREFEEEFYNIGDEGPSVSTIGRTLHRMNLSRTTLARIHRLQDHEKRLEYIERVAYADTDNLVDLDETAASPKEFLEKYGWSPVGDVSYRRQLKIGNKHYTVIAAYTTRGFLCWKVYEGSVTQEQWIDFLVTKVAEWIMPDSIALIDNATIHRTPNALHATENTFLGKFHFCAPYSPDLKPIERGFSLIKRWLRERENEALQDPIRMIEAAFFEFSVIGPQGHKGVKSL